MNRRFAVALCATLGLAALSDSTSAPRASAWPSVWAGAGDAGRESQAGALKALSGQGAEGAGAAGPAADSSLPLTFGGSYIGTDPAALVFLPAMLMAAPQETAWAWGFNG